MKKIRNAVELSVMCATLVLSLMLCSFVPVSYTHLTLPTTSRV